jgi:hypothetical protein
MLCTLLTAAERDVGVGELACGGERGEAVEAQPERLHLVPAAVHLLDDVAEALGARLLRGPGVGAARRRRRAPSRTPCSPSASRSRPGTWSAAGSPPTRRTTTNLAME